MGSIVVARALISVLALIRTELRGFNLFVSALTLHELTISELEPSNLTAQKIQEK
jgi:hypothetical protein